MIGKLQVHDFVTQRPYIFPNDAWNNDFSAFWGSRCSSCKQGCSKPDFGKVNEELNLASMGENLKL